VRKKKPTTHRACAGAKERCASGGPLKVYLDKLGLRKKNNRIERENGGISKCTPRKYLSTPAPARGKQGGGGTQRKRKKKDKGEKLISAAMPVTQKYVSCGFLWKGPYGRGEGGKSERRKETLNPPGER